MIISSPASEQLIQVRKKRANGMPNLHGVTIHKTAFFKADTVRISTLTLQSVHQSFVNFSNITLIYFDV
jgi:hypothetical protein